MRFETSSGGAGSPPNRRGEGRCRMADGGYLVTAQADAALAAIDLPGVRHVAALDSGEGFVAYDGLLPDVSFADIARWLVPATHPDFWPWAAIKRKPPMLGET